MAQNDEILNLSIPFPTDEGSWQDFLAMLSNINVRSGMTGFMTGSAGYFTGFSKGVAGIADGTPVFAVGDPSASPQKGISWDGSTFKVRGSAIVGSLVIGAGGSFSIGESAYGVGSGVWIDEDVSGNPRFSIQDKNGNFINIAMTSGGILGISSSGITGALSSKQIDDGGWKNQAIWLLVTGTGTTRASYNITDAQGTLPNATAVGQVLQRDNSGNPYFAAKYGSETNVFFDTITTTQAITAAAYTQVGVTVGFPKPSVATNASALCYFNYTGSATGLSLGLKMQKSLDGGSTWTDTSDETRTTSITGSEQVILRVDASAMGTGDFQCRLLASNVGAIGTITIQECHVLVIVCPNSGFYTITGALAASIPSTGTGNCIATYPTTTCTASVNVTVNPSGGTPPYTYAWSVVSGTGTITAGSTSQTCTVSDTETATTGGATHNTVIKCVVTDSVPNNVTTGNDTITNTFTLVYSPITATVSPFGNSCSNSTCGTNCTANGSLQANASGGNGNYTYSWSVLSGTATITSGATSQTVHVSDTQATGPLPSPQSTSTLQCSINDSRGTGAVTPQNSITFTFKCPTT